MGQRSSRGQQPASGAGIYFGPARRARRSDAYTEALAQISREGIRRDHLELLRSGLGDERIDRRHRILLDAVFATIPVQESFLDSAWALDALFDRSTARLRDGHYIGLYPRGPLIERLRSCLTAPGGIERWLDHESLRKYVIPAVIAQAWVDQIELADQQPTGAQGQAAMRRMFGELQRRGDDALLIVVSQNLARSCTMLNYSTFAYNLAYGIDLREPVSVFDHSRPLLGALEPLAEALGTDPQLLNNRWGSLRHEGIDTRLGQRLEYMLRRRLTRDNDEIDLRRLMAGVPSALYGVVAHDIALYVERTHQAPLYLAALRTSPISAQRVEQLSIAIQAALESLEDDVEPDNWPALICEHLLGAAGER